MGAIIVIAVVAAWLVLELLGGWTRAAAAWVLLAIAAHRRYRARWLEAVRTLEAIDAERVQWETHARNQSVKTIVLAGELDKTRTMARRVADELLAKNAELEAELNAWRQLGAGDAP